MFITKSVLTSTYIFTRRYNTLFGRDWNYDFVFNLERVFLERGHDIFVYDNHFIGAKADDTFFLK
jgi:hypothetical protein